MGKPQLGVQFLRFSATGAVGTAVQYLVLVWLVGARQRPVAVASLCGFVAGAVTNYFLARRFVFPSSRRHSIASFQFMAVAATGALFNTSVVQVLFDSGAHYLVAQMVATAVVLVWNFTANRYWTFRD